MIYDLIELPMRNMTGELSSVIPRFVHLPGIEDIDWYGRTIRLDGIRQGLHKYKSIEPIGNMTIERMFMTDEPIDFRKTWQTANINIYPIMYKVYKQPYLVECEVYRYLNGTLNVLGNIDCYSELQTLNNRLASVMFPFGGDFVHEHTRKMIPHVAYGNDDLMLSNYSTMRDFMNSTDDGFFYVESPLAIEDIFTPIPKDYTEDMFLRDIKLSQLKPLFTQQCNNGIYRNVMSYIPTPFEITKDTIFSEDYEMYRWCLHELIQAVERLVYTDLYIRIDYTEQHKVSAKYDVYSRYIGTSPSHVPGTKEAMSSIIESLRKWAGLTSGCTPVKVELWKNWAEEIFVSIVTPSKTTHYYFDIITYSLTNLSFVDILG
ncbi:MAG: hypothetical protein IKA36_02480 [Clostridia bacterium]|nr:hypothetical protein [Clostridia bacterium]